MSDGVGGAGYAFTGIFDGIALHNSRKLLESLQTLQELQKFIAHCEDENNKIALQPKLLNHSTSKLILIGPEGDFTKEEIDLALQQNYTPVSLGNTRLRTETAGLVAAVILTQL